MQRMTCLTKVVLRARTHTRLFQHLTASYRQETAMRQRRNLPSSVVTASLLFALGVASGSPVMAQNPPSVIQAGGSAGSGGSGIAIAFDSAGNSYVTGSFSGSVTFGSGALAVSRTASGSQDMFVAGYRPNGDLFWVQQAGVQSGKIVVGVLVDLTNRLRCRLR